MACQIDLKAILHSYLKSNPYKARGRVPRSDAASNTGFKFSTLVWLPNTVSQSCTQITRMTQIFSVSDGNNFCEISEISVRKNMHAGKSPKAPVPQAQVPNVIFAIFYLLLIGCCKGKTISATST